MHRVIQPTILYFGTPVVPIGTVAADGGFNLAPMSSAWWLGQRCILGLAGASKTTRTLIRTGQCVLNLPPESMAAYVDRIDPDKWRPSIMSFQHFYGLKPGTVHGSELAKIPEAAYRP